MNDSPCTAEQNDTQTISIATIETGFSTQYQHTVCTKKSPVLISFYAKLLDENGSLYIYHSDNQTGRKVCESEILSELRK